MRFGCFVLALPLALALFLCVVHVCAIPLPFKPCTSNGQYEVLDAEASYWPPKVGGVAVNISQLVHIEPDIADGEWKSTSKMFGITVDEQKGNLCDGSFGNFECPASGDVTVVSAVLPPSSAPFHGTVTTTATITVGGDVAGCWTVTFDI